MNTNKVLRCGISHTFRGTVLACIMLVSTNVVADELVHKFKNPSFSGIGTQTQQLRMLLKLQKEQHKEKLITQHYQNLYGT
jgi:hypothetical protein